MKHISQKIKKLNHNPAAHSEFPDWTPVIEKVPIHSITIGGDNPLPFNLGDDSLFLVTSVLPGHVAPTIIGIEHEYEDRDWLPTLAGYVEGLACYEFESEKDREYNEYIDSCVKACLAASTSLAVEKQEKKKLAEYRRKERKAAKKSAVRTIVEAKKSGASDKELKELKAQKIGEYSELLKSHGITDSKQWLNGLSESIRVNCEKVKAAV